MINCTCGVEYPGDLHFDSCALNKSLSLDVHQCEALDEFFMKCGYISTDYKIVHSLIRQLREMMNDVHNEPSGIR